MNWGALNLRKTRTFNLLLAVAAISPVSIAAGAASDIPRLSGSYRVVRKGK